MNATLAQAVNSALILLECAREDDGYHPSVDAAIGAMYDFLRDTNADRSPEDPLGSARCASRLAWTAVADCWDRRLVRQMTTTAKRIDRDVLTLAAKEDR